MRVESSVTSVTWVPPDVFTGALGAEKLGRADSTPPDRITGMADLRELAEAGRLRFGNLLAGWAEFDGETPTGAGYTGDFVAGVSRFGVGRTGVNFADVPLPLIQHPPELGAGRVKLVQTAGARTGTPIPRKTARPPFVRWHSPLAWTTLSLTLHSDGRSEWELAGASSFPRHWLYGPDSDVAAKSGVMDTTTWIEDSISERTPWGSQDSPAVVTAIETAIEHQLSHTLMSGGKHPRIVAADTGTVLAQQGAPGDSLFVLLDGVLSVEVDGTVVSEVGPGAVVGERALLEGGVRTATLTALTPVRGAVVDAADVDRAALQALADTHRREDQ